MPKKTTSKETVAATSPVRVTKPKAARTTVVVEAASKPRVRTVKHSKAAAAPVAAQITPVAVEASTAVAPSVIAHEIIAKIAYGYWEARGYQPGSAEQDWLRAEREYLLGA